MTAFDFYTAVVYAIVAAIVLLNVPTLLGILREGLAWLREALPSTSRRRRIRRFAARLRRASSIPSPQSTITAVSERERLDVIVRMSDWKARA